MLNPGPDDFLSLVTSEALAGCLDKAQRIGRISPRIGYGVGRSRVRGFPFRFTDFVAAAVSAHRRPDLQRDLVQEIGFEFLSVAWTFAEMSERRPHLLATEAANWDNTICSVLRSCRPTVVVIVDHIGMGTAGESGAAVPPEIMALGLNATGVAGFSASYRPVHPRGFEFGRIRALNAGAAQVCGLKKYLGIFGPEVN
jgi:hypothetical protein